MLVNEDFKINRLFGNKQKCSSNIDKTDVKLMESSNLVEPDHAGSVLCDLFALIECMSAVFDVLTWAVTQVKY